MIKHSKAAIVLEALIIGIRIKIGSHTWTLCNDDYGALRLGVIAKKYKGTSTKATDVVLFTELDVGGFVQLCDTLTEDEAVIIAANITLNQVKQ